MAAQERSSPGSSKRLWVPLLFTFAFTIHTGTAIKCWECNSRYDRNCADPFGNETFALTDCDQRELEHYPGEKSSVCRKIIQKVRDDYRFVRGCGWLSSGKDHTECMKRAGTFNVLIQYCSCNTDGCNHAPPAIATSWIGLLAIAFLMVVK